MPNKLTPNSPEELWQNQTEEETNVTLKDIRSQALKFQTKIRRRNLGEYIGIVVGTVIYCGFMWYLSGLLVKLGAAVTLAGMYFSVYQIRRDGSAHEVPVDSPPSECLEFHRQELTRQRDMLRRVGPWHIGPMMPGLSLFFVGSWIGNVHDLKDSLIVAASGVLTVAVLSFVYWLNVRAANKLDQELETLSQ